MICSAHIDPGNTPLAHMLGLGLGSTSRTPCAPPRSSAAWPAAAGEEVLTAAGLSP